MDDTWVIQQRDNNQEFLEHINSIDPAIKFTADGTQGNGGIPFLDTFVTPEADNSLSFTVYHKPTHTDQYLQWDTHHNLSTKYSVIGTLAHRVKTVCTKPELLHKELLHLREGLVKCKYPPGPSIGYKINLSTATGRKTMLTTSNLATTMQIQ